jgi:hypothetical protein
VLSTFAVTVKVTPELALLSFAVGCVVTYLAYRSAQRYEARTGVGAWRLPAGAWAAIFFVSSLLLSWLLALVLFAIAKATTKPRAVAGLPTAPPAYPADPPQPPPLAGWYPDPGGRHELRYWDGKGWTALVRDGSEQGTDPD